MGPQVILLLDAAALGVSPSVLEHVPDLADTIQRLLSRLDEPARMLSGVDEQARAVLARVMQARDDVDADYDPAPDARQPVERQFRHVAARLETAGDPAASDAWLGVARSVRYQRGRRDEFVEALIEAVRWDRGNTEAWVALADYASAAPHVPTFLAMFSRVPVAARPPVLKQMIATLQGRDRLGRMSPEAGEHLRGELLALARTEGDMTTVPALTGRRRSPARPEEH